ncbi:MAG: QueT transporter family protein [Succiniclasticum sp.]|uniref:QueT transporter family protein n=1 Tax=Succiniclasticum sp. TaxID=2775030 RepID=UPI002A91FA8C|nr:QueT transporter family protein [Succiniclasticum sp.]MBR1494630.1 QueT transporter family protein [Acidaminococcaceae bacterium]MDY6290313.1 QueT transporter family protein [Succiniclasticum sp.]
MNYKPSTILFVQGALIAASYVALTIVFAPLSFMEIQVRISESLTILPVFTAAAVPGLTIGCFLSNILCGAPLPDVIFGSLATLVGAVGTRLLRNRSPVLAVLPPIISNMLVIPFVLRYAYGVPLPIPLLMVAIGIGETISCGALGLLLYKILFPHRKNIFK